MVCVTCKNSVMPWRNAGTPGIATVTVGVPKPATPATPDPAAPRMLPKSWENCNSAVVVGCAPGSEPGILELDEVALLSAVVVVVVLLPAEADEDIEDVAENDQEGFEEEEDEVEDEEDDVEEEEEDGALVLAGSESVP